MEDRGREQAVKELEEKIQALPEKAQSAICWVIAHMDIVEEICGKSEMPAREIEEHIEDARNRNDFFIMALLYISQKYIEGKL